MTPDEQAAATLSEDQIDRLRSYGEVEATQPGDVLFQEGDSRYDFFVVLDGSVEITVQASGERRQLSTVGPGGFLGELNMLTGETVFATATITEAGEVLRIAIDRLREIIAAVPDLSDLILQAFLSRRTFLIDQARGGLKIVGSRFSSGTLQLREFAARNQIPHTWLDLEEDQGAEALLCTFEIKPSETPVVILGGECVLRNPTPTELAERLGVRMSAPPETTYDLLVIGAGPAGLAAAVYGASEGLSTFALEAIATGGQAGTSSKIENYLGFPAGLSGAELANRARVQAVKFGARISAPTEATGLRREGGFYMVTLQDGSEVTGRSVVIATGARYRKLDVPDLETFEDVGVYYAATETEARLCEKEEVVVVGGGNSAGQAALFLSERARKVYLMIRGGDLSKSMSRYLIDRIEHAPGIDVLTHTEIEALRGDGRLEGITCVNNQTSEEREIGARALFTFIGAEPHTGWLNGTLALDEHGFILTGNALKQPLAAAGDGEPLGRDPFLFETSLPGVFAVGDVRSSSVKRVASAVGEGSITVKFAYSYLAEA